MVFCFTAWRKRADDEILAVSRQLLYSVEFILLVEVFSAVGRRREEGLFRTEYTLLGILQITTIYDYIRWIDV